jgi:hypothetical protein
MGIVAAETEAVEVDSLFAVTSAQRFAVALQSRQMEAVEATVEYQCLLQKLEEALIVVLDRLETG